MAFSSLIVILCTLFVAHGQTIRRISETPASHVMHTATPSPVVQKSSEMIVSPVVKSTPMSAIISTREPPGSPSAVHSISISKSIKPSRSTAVKPSSSAQPTKPPTTKPTSMPPEKPRGFNVTTGNNTVCIRMKAIIKLDVTYFTTENKTAVHTIKIDESTKDVHVNGTCGKIDRMIGISVEGKLYMAMKFRKLGAGMLTGNGQWEGDAVAALVHTKSFDKSSGSDVKVIHNGTLFSSGMNSYYKCDSGEKINAGNIKFDFKDLKLQPFADGTHEEFGEQGTECDGDKTPKPTDAPDNDIVPIAVGCALAGLVVIVLIAYIIGRRRTHKGYQQV